MPIPTKGEKKSDFISRCTKQLIEKEKRKSDQARAICESYWDKSKKEKKKMGKIPLIMQNFLNTPLAILPAKAEEILEILQSKNTGELLRNEEFMALAKERMEGGPNYNVEDGIATIQIYGMLSKRMNMLMALSGGTSYEMFNKDYNAALDGSDVKGLFLYFDSPGGTIDGMVDSANLIYGSRGRKPIVAFTDGTMASAAYLMGSAADYIYAANGTTPQIGSIGIISVHLDYSKAYEKEGIKPTVFTAGKYKAIMNKYEQLDSTDKDYIQAELDYVYTAVVNDIARNRSMTVEMANSEMAEGRVFYGNQAWDAGLIDEVLTREQAMARLKEMI